MGCMKEQLDKSGRNGIKSRNSPVKITCLLEGRKIFAF
jgi:hypothetical protein